MQAFTSAQSVGVGVAGVSDAFIVVTATDCIQVPPPIPRTPPAQPCNPEWLSLTAFVACAGLAASVDQTFSSTLAQVWRAQAVHIHAGTPPACPEPLSQPPRAPGFTGSLLRLRRHRSDGLQLDGRFLAWQGRALRHRARWGEQCGHLGRSGDEKIRAFECVPCV